MVFTISIVQACMMASKSARNLKTFHLTLSYKALELSRVQFQAVSGHLPKSENSDLKMLLAEVPMAQPIRDLTNGSTVRHLRFVRDAFSWSDKGGRETGGIWLRLQRHK